MKGVYKRMIAILVLGLGLFVWWKLTPEHGRVRIANVGARSFSVGWFSDKPSKSCVWAVKGKIRNIRNWLVICEEQETYWHLVDFKDLEPNGEYSLFLVDGMRVTFKKILPVNLKKISDQPPGLPVPAYGNIVDQDKVKVQGVVVYISTESQSFSYPVAVKTDVNGRYGIDVSELVQKSDRMVLETVGKTGFWKEQLIHSQTIRPIPTINIVNQ